MGNGFLQRGDAKIKSAGVNSFWGTIGAMSGEEKTSQSCSESRKIIIKTLTLFDTLEPHGVFAVFDHSVDIPGGESGHRGVVDFQQQILLEEFPAVACGSAREELADDRELSALRAALQLQPQLPLLIPAKDTLVDFVGPVVLSLLQSLGHGEFT